MTEESGEDDESEVAKDHASPTSASGPKIVSALACTRVQEAQAYARKLRLVADLYHDRDMAPPAAAAKGSTRSGRPRAALTRAELTAAEIQGPLEITSIAAGQLVRRAVALTARLTSTFELLSAGALDAARADAIADTLAPVLDATYDAHLRREGSPGRAERATRDVAAEFERRLLGRARSQTVPLLRRSLARAVMALAPDYDEARRREHADARDVYVSTHGQEPGIAFFGAHLPVVEAQACYHELDTTARTLRRNGDPRTLDQLRADALVRAILRPAPQTSASHNPDPEPGADTTGGSAPDVDSDTDTSARKWTPAHAVARGVKAHVQITISWRTLLGLDDHAAELAGYGPIPAKVARELAFQPGSTWRRLITDPRTGQLLDYGRKTYRPPVALADHVIARDVTCRHPGCLRPAELTDVDHIVPYPLGATSQTNLACRCRRHHRLKHEAGWQTDHSTDPADPPGTIITTSRTGQTYRSHPPDLHPDQDLDDHPVDRFDDRFDRSERAPDPESLADARRQRTVRRALRFLNEQARIDAETEARTSTESSPEFRVRTPGDNRTDQPERTTDRTPPDADGGSGRPCPPMTGDDSPSGRSPDREPPF